MSPASKIAATASAPKATGVRTEDSRSLALMKPMGHRIVTPGMPIQIV
jgi:hypothetical protein